MVPQRILPDVNILIALVDANHVHREVALSWHASMDGVEMLTCPITENAVVRIVSNPKYPNGPFLPHEVCGALRLLKQIGKWTFVPDDQSILDETLFVDEKLNYPNQLTDIYLAGLCHRHQAQLATMDRKLAVTAVRGIKPDLVLQV